MSPRLTPYCVNLVQVDLMKMNISFRPSHSTSQTSTMLNSSKRLLLSKKLKYPTLTLKKNPWQVGYQMIHVSFLIFLQWNYFVIVWQCHLSSSPGKFQCLIQLSTLPVAVCYGSGHTSKEAQSAAAQNTLEYLKILTKLWRDSQCTGGHLCDNNFQSFGVSGGCLQ